MIKKLFGWLSKKPEQAMSFQSSMDLSNLPVVTFKQKDNKFNFLLDSGSTCNIIDSNILDKIINTPIEDTDGQNVVQGLEGTKKEVNACKIELSYKDKVYEHEYLINDMSSVFGAIKNETGVTLHGLLGTEFFSRYKYVLDFDELIAYSKE